MMATASSVAHASGGNMDAAAAASSSDTAAAAARGEMRPGHMLPEEDFFVPVQMYAALGLPVELIG